MKIDLPQSIIPPEPCPLALITLVYTGHLLSRTCAIYLISVYMHLCEGFFSGLITRYNTEPVTH